MPRPVLLLSCVLLIATGLGVIGLAQTAGPLPVRDAPVDTVGAVATARDFYAAINAVLAMGDAAALDDSVAIDLVEHPGRPGATGRSGLVTPLLARRAVFPGMKVVVEDAHPAGDDLVA